MGHLSPTIRSVITPTGFCDGFRHCTPITDCPSSNMAFKATYVFAFLALMVHLSVAGASQHVVSGILDCGQASGWTDGGVVLNQVHYPYGKKITLNFKQPYDTP